DRQTADIAVIKLAGCETGAGGRVEAVAAGHPAKDRRVLPADDAAEIGRHRFGVGDVAANAFADRRAEPDVVLGRPIGEWLAVAATSGVPLPQAAVVTALV